MNVSIVHYHARPGGVTRVVERTVESLDSTVRCLFFIGEPAQGKTPLRSKIRVIPALGYSVDNLFKKLKLLEHARSAFGGEPDLWHIHNHSLGKNPALIQEIISLAMAGQKILLQIHDFAEDGRPDNYSSLRKLTRLYPIAPHIHYATINARDARFLRAAGIPKSTIHFLPNAVSSPSTSKNIKHPTPSSEWFYVYPCRAIRRKNIGELLLWSARMPDAHFAVTLAPKNPDAKPIYNMWVTFAKELGLSIEFNEGTKNPFHKMIAKADALITTSIAEGFGFVFLEPWLANKPLVGRNLPEITADFTKHRLDFSSLYDRLPVPLLSDQWNIQNEFLQTLETKLRASCNAYGRPCDMIEKARSALIQNNAVDFGILDEKMQRKIIRAIKNEPSQLPFNLGDSTSVIAKNRVITETVYNLETYGRQLLSIYQNLQNTKPGTLSYANQEKLLDAFLAPNRFNLLRTSTHR